MAEVQEKIAVAAEFDDEKLGPPPAKPTRPMRLHPNKAQASAFPDSDLAHRAASVVVRPTSGRVLVYDKDGVALARYSDPVQAVQKLEHAKVKLDALSGGAVLLKRGAPPAVVEEKTKEPPSKK